MAAPEGRDRVDAGLDTRAEGNASFVSMAPQNLFSETGFFPLSYFRDIYLYFCYSISSILIQRFILPRYFLLRLPFLSQHTHKSAQDGYERGGLQWRVQYRY